MSRPTTPTSEFFSNFEGFLKKFKLTTENDRDQEILTLANLDSGRIRKFIVKKVDERSLFRRSSQKSLKDENENKSKKSSSKNGSIRKEKSGKARKLSASSIYSLKRFGSKQSLASNKSSPSKKKRRGSFGSGKFKIGWGSSSSSEEEFPDEPFGGPEFEMTAKDRDDEKESGFVNHAIVKEDFEDEGVELGREDPAEEMEPVKRDLAEDTSDTGSLSSLASSASLSPRFNLKMSPVPKRRGNKKVEPSHSPVSFRGGYQSNRSSISSVRKGILKKTNSCTTINMEMANLSRPETPTENGHNSRSMESFDDAYPNGDTSRFVRAGDTQKSFNRVKFILDSGRPDNITGDYDDIKIEKNNDKNDRLDKGKVNDKSHHNGLSRSGRKCLVFSAGLLIMTMAVILGSFFGSRKSGLPPKALANAASSLNKHIAFAVEGKFKILNENFAAYLYNHESPEFKKMSKALEYVMVKAIFIEETANQPNSTIKLKVVKYEKGSVISVFRIKWEQTPTLKLSEIRKRILKHLEKYGAFGEYKVDKSSFSISELRDLCDRNLQNCSHVCALSDDTLRFGCICPDNLILVNSTECISPTLTTTTEKASILIPNVISKVLKDNNAQLLEINREKKVESHPVEKPSTEDEVNKEVAQEESQSKDEKKETNVTSGKGDTTNTTQASVEPKAAVEGTPLPPTSETEETSTKHPTEESETSMEKTPDKDSEDETPISSEKPPEEVPSEVGETPREPVKPEDSKPVESESSPDTPDKTVADTGSKEGEPSTIVSEEESVTTIAPMEEPESPDKKSPGVDETILEEVTPSAGVGPEPQETDNEASIDELHSYSEDVTESGINIMTLDDGDEYSLKTKPVEDVKTPHTQHQDEGSLDVNFVQIDDATAPLHPGEGGYEVVKGKTESQDSVETSQTKVPNTTPASNVSGHTNLQASVSSQGSSEQTPTVTLVPEIFLTVDPNLNEVSDYKDPEVGKPETSTFQPTLSPNTSVQNATVPTLAANATVRTTTIVDYVLSSAKHELTVEVVTDSPNVPLSEVGDIEVPTVNATETDESRDLADVQESSNVTVTSSAKPTESPKATATSQSSILTPETTTEKTKEQENILVPTTSQKSTSQTTTTTTASSSTITTTSSESTSSSITTLSTKHISESSESTTLSTTSTPSPSSSSTAPDTESLNTTLTEAPSLNTTTSAAASPLSTASPEASSSSSTTSTEIPTTSSATSSSSSVTMPPSSTLVMSHLPSNMSTTENPSSSSVPSSALPPSNTTTEALLPPNDTSTSAPPPLSTILNIDTVESTSLPTTQKDQVPVVSSSAETNTPATTKSESITSSIPSSSTSSSVINVDKSDHPKKVIIVEPTIAPSPEIQDLKPNKTNVYPQRHIVTVQGFSSPKGTTPTTPSQQTPLVVTSVSVSTKATPAPMPEVKTPDSEVSIDLGLISDVSHDLSGASPKDRDQVEETVHSDGVNDTQDTLTFVTPIPVLLNVTSSISTTTTLPPCSEDEFQCKEGSCVSKKARCDSVVDCIDNSDEIQCIENKCLDNYQCRWSGDCLARRFVCDGIKHCTDGDDEEGCETWKCSADEFQCEPGSVSACIPLSRKCDGHPDCFNRSDEFNCSSKCSKEKFMCPEGSCIPNLWKCDGRADCINGEDEADCDCEGLDQSPCAVGGCVPTFKLCDGLRQCPDGSDEWGCLRIDNDAKQLQVRSSGGRWSAVCGDKWTAQWTDLVCEQLGFGVSQSTEVRRVPEPVLRPRVRLSPDPLMLSRRGSGPLQYFLTHGECPNDPLVHVSCKMQECGLWNASMPELALISHSAKPELWPSLGLLIQPEAYENPTMAYKSSCAASIITPSWVLTSYSCLSSKPSGFEAEKWALLTGESSPIAGQGNTQLKYANRMVFYPGAKRLGNLWVGDAVLLRLQTPLQFGPDIQPICLSDEVAHSHDQCVIASWKRPKGDTLSGMEQRINQTVQILPVPNLTLNTCNTSYYAGQLSKEQACASFLQPKNSACAGNEGAPLMCRRKNGPWRLHGLLSHTGSCASFNLPSVFTDISTIHSWLLNTIGRPLPNGQSQSKSTSSTTTTPTTTTTTTPSTSTTTATPIPTANEAVLGNAHVASVSIVGANSPADDMPLLPNHSSDNREQDTPLNEMSEVNGTVISFSSS